MERITDLSVIEHGLCMKLFSFCGSAYVNPLYWPFGVCKTYDDYQHDQLISIKEYVEYCKDYRNLREPNCFNKFFMRGICYTIFCAFVADFDEDKQLFKLKDNLRTETDVYELFLNPKEYIKKHYTHEEIYHGYMPGGNIDVYTLESILGSSFAAKVFKNKQQQETHHEKHGELRFVML